MSKFDIKVQYLPGKENVVADAMSRYAYPAGKALQDCTWHGSAQDHEEMREIIRQELEEEKTFGVWCPGPDSTLERPKGVLLVIGKNNGC